MRKGVGHTAVSATQASSVTLKISEPGYHGILSSLLKLGTLIFSGKNSFCGVMS